VDIELSSKFLGVLLVAESLAVAVFDAAIFLQPLVEGIGIEAFLPSVALDGALRIGLMFAFFGFRSRGHCSSGTTTAPLGG
jgi:hypothetical protein